MVIAFACSVWFVLLGWMWVYFLNIVFVFPIAIVGFIFWRKGKTERKNLLHSATGILLIIGALISLAAYFCTPELISMGIK